MKATKGVVESPLFGGENEYLIGGADRTSGCRSKYGRGARAQTDGPSLTRTQLQTWLSIDKAPLDRDHDCMRAIIGSELRKDILEMSFNRVL